MTRGLNSPRGAAWFAKIEINGVAIDAPASTYLQLESGLALSSKTSFMTQNSTGLVLPGGVKISNARTITANSTAFIGTAQATLPTTDNGAAFTLISNSTGVALAVNSTGTTWKYLNVTSVQPT